MIGDGVFSPDPILAGLDDPAPAPVDETAILGLAVPSGLDLGVQAASPLLTYDVWGLTRIPTIAGYNFTPQFASGWVSPMAVPTADVCLGVILDYLSTFLVTDQNATAAWSLVCPNLPTQNRPSAAVVRIFAHNPSEVVFSGAYCPALFLWRADPEETNQTWEADDWLREATVLKGLWVYPQTLADNQRIRSTFSHVLAKLLAIAIERGRTPSWIQPGDPDHLAMTQGSLFYTYAGFESFWLDKWKNKPLRLIGADGKVADEYAAIELTFTLHEKVDWGLDREPPVKTLIGGFETVLNQNGQPVVSGFLP